MSLKNGKHSLNGNKESLKERLKEVFKIPEFKFGCIVLIGLAIVLVLQLNGLL